MFDQENEGPREEHLAWCKERALEYVKLGKLDLAWTSFMSDMGKHSGTAQHQALMLGIMLMSVHSLNTKAAMSDFINGFN